MDFKKLADKYKYLAFDINSKKDFNLLLKDLEISFGDDIHPNFLKYKLFYLLNYNDNFNYICVINRQYSQSKRKIFYSFFLINKNEKDYFYYKIIDYISAIRKEKIEKLNKNL